MKTKAILISVVLLVGPRAAVAQTNDLPALVQRGLFEEEANHQLDAAIRDYQEAIQNFDHDRQLAATAIFRLGECYRKLGNTNQANAQYERIVREFSDQTPLVELCRGYLPAQAGKPANPSEAATPALPTEEEQALRSVQEMVRTSPDLINHPRTGGLSPLANAVYSGHLAVVQFLVTHGADVNARDADGGPPLGLAAGVGNKAIVELLLANGADVNGRDGRGATALSRAVEKGFKAVAETLILHGADVNANAKGLQGWTPLHTAVYSGFLSLAELLLDHNADVDAKDKTGNTPLFYAVEKESSSLAEMLLSHKADVGARNEKGKTPLFYAVEKSSPSLVEILLSHKADADAKDGAGETPLFAAVRNGDATNMDLLLEHQANVNLQTTDGLTPLLAAFEGPEQTVKAVVETLLTHGAGTEAQLPEKANLANGQKFRPLNWAIAADRVDLVQLLLKHHADPNSRFTFLAPAVLRNTTPLLQAAWEDNHPAGPQFPGTFSFAPAGPYPGRGSVPGGFRGLVQPAQHSNAGEIAQLLLDAGAKPDLTNDDGNTALFFACSTGNAEIAKALIAHHANVNVVDKQGRPLLALFGDNAQIKNLLLQAGADANYERRQGIFILSNPAVPPAKVFGVGTNDMDRHTLLEFISAAYEVVSNGMNQSAINVALNGLDAKPHQFIVPARYVRKESAVPFPDFAHVKISRLNGNTVQEINLDAATILQSGDGSKDIWLQEGDYVEIAELAHRVTDQWKGFPGSVVSNLDRCLLRTVQIVVRGKTTDVALLPAVAVDPKSPWGQMSGTVWTFYMGTLNPSSDWLASVLEGRKAAAVVQSFPFDRVVREANVILNTSDLRRVQLNRHGAKMTFDLTARPPPEVWLRNGDVIEIPERD